MTWRVTCLCAHWMGYAPTREIAVSLCDHHRTEQPERADHVTAMTDINGESEPPVRNDNSTPAR